MKKLEQLEKRIDDAIVHYETHKAAFETLSQKLASYNGIRAEVLEEVKGWIAALREPELTDESAPADTQTECDLDIPVEDSEEDERILDVQDDTDMEEKKTS